MNRLLRRAPIVALLLYAALSVFYTRPLLLHITSAVPGGDTDGRQNLWDLWWTPFALFNQHQSPFHTTWIFYQSGSNLYFHTLAPLLGLISAPFQMIGPVFAENIVILLSYLLTAFATYLLARLLLRNYLATTPQSGINPVPTNESQQGGIDPSLSYEPQGGINPTPTDNHSALSTQHSALLESAAFLAGFAFAFASPWRLQYLYGGQVERLSIEWVPLFMYFAYRAYLGRSWRDAVFTTLCSIAAALTDLQYILYIVIFSLILLIVELIAKGWRAWLPPAMRLIGAGVLATLVFSPLLYAMLKDLATHPDLAPATSATILHSADLLELFAPNRTNPIWGGLADHLNMSIYSKYLVFGAFSPPYIILALALVGLVLAWRWLQIRVLLVSLITFLLISFGPLLHIGGKVFYTPFGGNILMPYALLYYLPFVKVSRDPERFGEMAFLCWALLAALGSFVLARRLLLPSPTLPYDRGGGNKPAPTQGRDREARRRGWLVASGFALALLLAGIEFVKITPPLPAFSVPPFYQQLVQDTAHYAILEMPFFKGGDEDQWFSYQTVHHKYLFGGNLARKQPHPFIEDTPALNWFAAQQPPSGDIVPTPPVSVAFDVLRWANVQYVTLIKQPVVGQSLKGAQAVIKSIWGANTNPYYSDSIMDVYAVPTTTTTLSSAAATGPLLAVGAGWYSFETDARGGHRWISGEQYNTDGYLTVLSLGGGGSYTLTFRAFSYSKPQPVQVKYQGRIITTITITPTEQTFNIPLTLVADRSEIILHYLGQPTSPQANGAANDPRLLSVGFGNISLHHLHQ